MDFRPLALAGLLEIRPSKVADPRGYFSEIFRLDRFVRHGGEMAFVQENQSLNIRAGTIRGLHFQVPPAAQGKLIRCLSGLLFDVAVDLRSGSETYGQWAAILLSPEDNNQLWVPPGFGHGFCTLEPDTVVSYWVTDYYSADHDKGVAWDDPDIAIAWPEIADPDTLSNKDREQPRLRDLPACFTAAEDECA